MLIEPFRPENAGTVAAWCAEKDETFLYQWGVEDYIYPLTADQILRRLQAGKEMYQATEDGKIAATIEVLSRRECLAGKFLADPLRTGQGFGSRVLCTFKEYCREELGFSRLCLYVFDFNLPARRCYEKCGFSPVRSELRPNDMTAILMEVAL